MKKDWNLKKLGELCEVVSGYGFPKKFQGSTDKAIPFLKVSDMNLPGNEMNIVYSNNSVSEVELKQMKAKSFPKNTIIFPKIGAAIATNKKRITSKQSTFDNNVMGLVKKSDLVDLRYLYVWIQNFNLTNWASDSELPSMRKSRVEEEVVPLPSLSEQKRIVKILDEKFDAIEKLKKVTVEQLKDVKELFESRLEEIFQDNLDWSRSKIADIGVVQTGGTPKSSENGRCGNYVPFIKPADVDVDGEGTLNYSNAGLSFEGYKTSRKISSNSVVMVCIGASITKVGFSLTEITSNQQINSLTPSDNFVPKFIYYAMRTDGFRNKVIKSSSQATLPIINKTKWGNLCISYPDKSKQELVVKELDELLMNVKKLEKVFMEKLTCLEELKKSYLEQAFAGKL